MTADPRVPNLAGTPHGCPSQVRHARETLEIDLPSPLTIRTATLLIRLVMSTMWHYCADAGSANDWHLVHLGSSAAGGVGLVVVEATAVAPEGGVPQGYGHLGRSTRRTAGADRAFVHSQGPSPASSWPGRKAVATCPGLEGA